MCGILGMQVTESTKTKEITQEAYKKQKSRGHEGFGLGLITPSDKMERTRATKEDKIFESPLLNEREGYLVFHNRMPTSTPNLVRCNHPFFNEDRTILMVHNGVISEDKAKKLLTSKHVFESQVYLSYLDTENYIVGTKKRMRTDTEYALHFYEEARQTKDWVKALKAMATEPAFSHSTFLILEKGIKGVLFLSTGAALQSSDYNGTKVLNSDGYSLCDTLGILQDNEVKVVERLPNSYAMGSYNYIYDEYGCAYGEGGFVGRGSIDGGILVYGRHGEYRLYRDKNKAWQCDEVKNPKPTIDPTDNVRRYHAGISDAFDAPKRLPVKKYKFFLDVPNIFYAITEFDARLQLREYFRKNYDKAEMMADSYEPLESDSNIGTCDG